MAKKDNTIQILNFQKGIGQSPYVGFEELRCLNVTDKPGICYPNGALSKESVSVVVDRIIGTCVDGNNMYGFSNETYIDIYKYTGGICGTWTELSGQTASKINGIAFWKKYLIVLHSDGQMDATDDDGTSWNLLFDDFGDSVGYRCPSLIASNNVLYFGRKNILNNLAEKDGQTFDPSSSATFDLDTSYPSLDLPANVIITNIVELGSKLLIGTRPENNADTSCYLFIWDKTSTSYEQIKIEEGGINYLVSDGNLAYIQAGKEGEWYITNGTSVEFLNKIPTALAQNADYNNPASCAMWRNKIYFAVDGNSIGSDFGVWSLDIRTNAISYEYIISTGETGINDGVIIGTVTNVNDELVVTWEDEENASFGSDGVSSTGYTGDTAYLVSQYYQLAGPLDTLTSKRFDLNLAKPCGASDSVKVFYRTAQNETFTKQITGLTMGEDDQNKSITKSITRIKGIQFKIVLNGAAELLNFEMTI